VFLQVSGADLPVDAVDAGAADVMRTWPAWAWGLGGIDDVDDVDDVRPAVLTELYCSHGILIVACLVACWLGEAAGLVDSSAGPRPADDEVVDELLGRGLTSEEPLEDHGPAQPGVVLGGDQHAGGLQEPVQGAADVGNDVLEG